MMCGLVSIGIETKKHYIFSRFQCLDWLYFSKRDDLMDESIRKQFIIYLVGKKNLRPSTAQTYANKMRVFERRHDLDSAKHQDVIDYLAYMKLEGYKSQNERRLMQTALIQFYGWYAPIAGIPNPAVDLEPIKKQYTDPRILTPDEFIRVLYWTAKKEGERGIRDAAVLAFFAETGIRPDEFERMKLGDVRLRDDDFEVTIPSSKGTHSRTIQFCNLQDGAISEYFSRYYIWVITEKKQEKHRPLFFQLEWRNRYPENLMQPLKRNGVRYILERAAYNAGIDRKLTIYMIRHYFATYAIIEGGMDLIDLQYVLGHVDPKTTLNYIHIAARITGKISKQSPNRKLKAQPFMSGYSKLLKDINR
jgi:site-specific recombinase XerD